MKLTLLFCFSLFVTLSFGQSFEKKWEQTPYFLQEKGGSFVKVNSSGKLYVSGLQDFSFHLEYNPDNKKEALVVDDTYGLKLSLDINDQPLFAKAGPYFQVMEVTGQAPGFLIIQNDNYLAFHEGEFNWESSFDFANALWLREKGSRAQPGRSNSNSGSILSSKEKKKSESASPSPRPSPRPTPPRPTPRPQPKPQPKTGKAIVTLACDKCNCQKYELILKQGVRIPPRGIGRLDKNCQAVISDLSPGSYQLELKTARSGGGGEFAETPLVMITVKIDRPNFSVRAGQTEKINIREVR